MFVILPLLLEKKYLGFCGGRFHSSERMFLSIWKPLVQISYKILCNSILTVGAGISPVWGPPARPCVLWSWFHYRTMQRLNANLWLVCWGGVIPFRMKTANILAPSFSCVHSMDGLGGCLSWFTESWLALKYSPEHLFMYTDSPIPTIGKAQRFQFLEVIISLLSVFNCLRNFQIAFAI